MRARVGCQLPQTSGDFEEILSVASLCEKLGYDSVWAFDHLSPFWDKKGNAFECWTTLAAVAARTRKIRIGSLVSNVNLRNPSLLAKVTSSLDSLSNGRLIVGLGTGDSMSRNELQSYGYDFPGIETRVMRLRETIDILKEMWTREVSDYTGRAFKIDKALNAPKPKQKPHPPIWIGGKHTMILDVVAEMADGWNYWNIDKRTLAKCQDYVSAKCAHLGRDPQEITKSWAGTLRDSRADDMARTLEQQIDSETSYFIVSFGPNANPKAYEQFIEAVAHVTM